MIKSYFQSNPELTKTAEPLWQCYLLKDVIKGSLQFVMSGRQFSEIPVSLQDGDDDLVDLIHCLIETTL